MKLNEIRDNLRSSKKRMRVGRGIGSGKGKTSGAGGKGQTARSGVSIRGFEGGQMPLYRRLPKRGFNNPLAKRYSVINLSDLQRAIESKKIDASCLVNLEVLRVSRLVTRPFDGVRLLGNGQLSSCVNIELSGASKVARLAVEKMGGAIHFVK